MADRGRMRLGAYYNPTGHHVASWRHPRAQKDAHVNIKHYVEIAQTAERAKLDMIFLADSAATRKADIEALSRSIQFIANFEPITLLSALAMVTERIGLIATASTSYNAHDPSVAILELRGLAHELLGHGSLSPSRPHL